MANILDYLDWRSDVPFSVSPFNEIDGLILSEFVYLPFEGIVPHSFTLRISIREAREQFLSERIDENSRNFTFDRDLALFDRLACSERFGSTQMTGFIARNDEETQFSVITFLLGDGTTYIAFRGTDNTLVAWKEDMNLSVMSATCAQELACDYLNAHFIQHPRPLRLGGHSKGGNLAIFAAAFCREEVRSRILAVQAYDSPGFREEIADSPEYAAILPKISTYIPESSVVGMLLNSRTDPVIVKSSGNNIEQHFAFNWEVRRDCFSEAAALSGSGDRISRALAAWINQYEDEQRRQLIDLVFGVLGATDAHTIQDLTRDKRSTVSAVVHAVRSLPNEQQKFLLDAFMGFARSLNEG
ncbi:MAG: DUF2974 domain-containing protein [Oscillospiraceae bacterium]|nr:DUF2974 domain-containing protein [Oscillospiraceae bacterium]